MYGFWSFLLINLSQNINVLLDYGASNRVATTVKTLRFLHG